jgi:hypothetical protein
MRIYDELCSSFFTPFGNLDGSVGGVADINGCKCSSPARALLVLAAEQIRP